MSQIPSIHDLFVTVVWRHCIRGRLGTKEKCRGSRGVAAFKGLLGCLQYIQLEGWLLFDMCIARCKIARIPSSRTFIVVYRLFSGPAPEVGMIVERHHGRSVIVYPYLRTAERGGEDSLTSSWTFPHCLPSLMD